MSRSYLLAALTLCAVLAPPIAAAADGKDISFDAGTDFHAVKTFAIHGGQLRTGKPEIDNRLFRQRLEDSVRAALVKKGLVEAADGADVSVTYSFNDKDVSAVDRRPAARIPDSPGMRGLVIRGGENPELYTEGTLIIDITSASNSLLWRGTWRDQEESGPKLSRNLSEDARKLLSEYPPKRK